MGYVTVDEDFSTIYDTYVVAYCPDTNSWFITNERHWYFQFENEFASWDDGYLWFSNNLGLVIDTQNEMLQSNNQKLKDCAWLDKEEDGEIKSFKFDRYGMITR
jgi:hypothetical protein